MSQSSMTQLGGVVQRAAEAPEADLSQAGYPLRPRYVRTTGVGGLASPHAEGRKRQQGALSDGE